MKGYRIFCTDIIGFDSKVEYALDFNKAVQIFNNKVRNEIKEIGGELVDINDFRESISSFRDSFKINEDKCEIISRKYPYILYKDKKDNYVAEIKYWNRTSYEYEEYDISITNVIIESIDIKE